MTIHDVEDELRTRLDAERFFEDALDPWGTWKVFKGFLAVPVEGDIYDAASFQCNRFDSDAGEPADVAIYFVRQFSCREDGDEAFLRRFVVEFRYREPELIRASDDEVWTRDFPTLQEFASVVEGRPSFQAAVADAPSVTELYSEEL